MKKVGGLTPRPSSDCSRQRSRQRSDYGDLKGVEVTDFFDRFSPDEFC